MVHITLVILLNFLLFISPTLAQQLEAIKCDAEFPTPHFGTSAVYDGDDTIYIFGHSRVFAFSISSDSIRTIADITFPSSFGNSIITSNGDIFHIPGESDGIYYFNLTSAEFKRMDSSGSGSFSANRGSALVQYAPDRALLFGGRNSDLSVIDINFGTMTFSEVSQMPSGANDASGFMAGEFAYIFPSNDEGHPMKYHRASQQFLELSSWLPLLLFKTQAVWTGQFGYIIGRFSTEIPAGNILQFDPSKEEIKPIPVGGAVGWANYKFADISAVYVEKVKGIYIFGGVSFPGGSVRSEIYFISLEPLQVDPTETPPSPNSTYSSSSGAPTSTEQAPIRTTEEDQTNPPDVSSTSISPGLSSTTTEAGAGAGASSLSQITVISTPFTIIILIMLANNMHL